MTQIRAKEIIKAVFIITLFSVITRALGFLFRIYLSWELGAEMLGLYQVAFSLLGVLMVLVSSGLPLALSKQTAKYNILKRKDKINSSTSATLIIASFLAIIISLLVFVFKDLISKVFTDTRCMEILIALLPAVFFTAIYASFRGSLWGQKQYFLVGFTEFLEQFLRILIFFLFAFVLTTKLNNAINAAISLSIACLLSAFFTMIIYFIKGNKLGKPNQEYRKILNSATPVTGVRVASSLLQPIIAIIIPLQLISSGLTKELAMSEFGIAVGMTLPLLFLPSTLIGSLAMVLLPELSSLIEEKNKDLAEKQINSALKFSIFISMLVVPLYMGMWEDIGLFIFNNEKSGYYLMLSAWVMIPMALSNISSTILNALGLESKSFKNYIIGAVFLIVSIIFLTKYIGICALIIGLGGCLTIASILNLRLMHKKLGFSTNVLSIVTKMGFASMPVLLLTRFSYNILSGYMPTFFALAFGSIIGTLCFVILCWTFKLIDISNFLNLYKKTKNKSSVYPINNI